MGSRAVVIINNGDEWFQKVALNYTQLSIDHSVSSRYIQSDYSYYIRSTFNQDEFRTYDYVLVLNAGVLLLWGNYEKNVLPFIGNEEYTNIGENAYVWQPSGNGTKDIDLYLGFISSDTHESFVSTHSASIINLIDDSNISYLMHYEIPIYGGVSHQMDWAITVGSGFFVNGLLHHHGFHSGTEVHHIDISKMSLEARKYTIEDWNGKNLPAWINHLYYRFRSMKLFNRNKFTEADKDYMAIWEDLQESFGDDWIDHWKKYRALNHKFHRLNICELDQVKKLLDQMPSPNGVIWWNGALKRMPSNLLKDSKASHDYAISFVKEIEKRYPGVVCYGSDHCLQQYNGLDARIVLKLIEQENSRDTLWQKQ